LAITGVQHLSFWINRSYHKQQKRFSGLSVFGAMQMAQCNAMAKRNPAKRVQNKRALLAYYFIQSAVAEWKSK